MGWLSVDLTPLRVSPTYRRLWIATLITALGTQATFVTLAYQLSALTNSALAVGALGAVELVPLIVFGLLGGVLADSLDRRVLVLATEAALMLGSVALLGNALLTHPAAWVLYVVVIIQTTAASLQQPSLDSLRQQVIPHELQRQATTLNSVRYNATAIVGPALGGILAVSVGSGSVYTLDVFSFCCSLYLLAQVHPPSRVGKKVEVEFASLTAGLSYAISRRDLLGTYLMDLAAMLFAYPIVMLPFVARSFHTPGALAMLYAALPLGAFVGSVTANAWTGKIHRYGRAITIAAASWGVGIAIFGWGPNLAICLFGLFAAGWADTISALFRGTMWNQSIPPSVRGRMASVELLSYSIGPSAGQLRSGVMATALSLRASLAIGGLACTGVCAGLAAALPAMWNFDVRTDANVHEVERIRADEVAHGGEAD